MDSERVLEVVETASEVSGEPVPGYLILSPAMVRCNDALFSIRFFEPLSESQTLGTD